MRLVKLAAVLIAALALALWQVASVAAHAHLVSSTPAAGARLTTPPTTVVITFDDDLDPNDTRITVLGPNGQTVSTGKTTVSASDSKVASVAISPAGDGVYTVNWRSVANDDKGVVEDSFTFGVNATAPVAMPATGGGGMARTAAPVPWLPMSAVGVLLVSAVLGFRYRCRRG